MRTTLCATLCAVCLVPAIACADVAAINMDPGYVSIGWATSVGYTNNSDYRNEAAGQLFTPTLTGKLSTLHATVDRFVGGEPLIVSIHQATGTGLPGTLLGSIAIPEAQVSGWPLSSTWDLSSLNIDLVAGTPYVVTFRVTTPLFQSTRYRALLTAPNARSFGVRSLISKDGVTWQPSNVQPEIGLIVSVASPPPPPPDPQEVVIDVVPSSADNKINLKSKNPKPLEVAVFGAADFDVRAVVPQTMELGDPVLTDPDLGTGQKVAPTDTAYSDLNGDGELDLLLTFDLLQLQDFGAVDSSSAELEFVASLENGGIAFGSDGVSISGAKGKGKGNK